MKQVTITLPGEQLDFFVQLVHKLGFDVEEETEIPEIQKNIVMDRIRESKPEELLQWKTARKKLVFKNE